MSIESFTDNPLGKLVIGVLTVINRITVMKKGDGEKTPLDTPTGTVITGLVVLGAAMLAVRIAAIVS